MISQLNLFIIVMVSLILAVFFGGLGSSLLSLDRSSPENKSKGNGYSSVILSVFFSNPSGFLTTVLLGYFLSLVCYTLAFAEMIHSFLNQNLHITSPALILLLQALFILLLIVITLFIIRLSVFRVNPLSTLKSLALPALFFYLLFYLVSVFLLGIINFISRFLLRINLKTRKASFFYRFTLPEFFYPYNISESIKENADKEVPEVKIFQNALEFSKLKARDCMVPRNEIEALDVNSSMKDLRERFVQSGYSKILVFEGTIDNMIGYISSKELFKDPDSIKSILVSMSVVPESMQINKLLHNLIKERRSIALVVDEYGGTSGIVTLEDIMEEIFGEIEDEHDIQEFTERQVNEREFILSGRLEIDYLNEKYKFNIPEAEEYDTLAGFIIYHYESIPKLNTRVIVNDLSIRILKVSQTRIELVHVTREPAEEKN